MKGKIGYPTYSSNKEIEKRQKRCDSKFTLVQLFLFHVLPLFHKNFSKSIWKNWINYFIDCSTIKLIPKIRIYKNIKSLVYVPIFILWWNEYEYFYTIIDIIGN